MNPRSTPPSGVGGERQRESVLVTNARSTPTSGVAAGDFDFGVARLQTGFVPASDQAPGVTSSDAVAAVGQTKTQPSAKRTVDAGGASTADPVLLAELLEGKKKPLFPV